MLDYQRLDTTLTLSEGLREYYASHEQLVTGRGVSDDAREFFRCHDAAHVVFGCSIALPDEAVVKIWSLFGTTDGFGLLAGYRLPESQEIYQTLGVGLVLSTTLRMMRLGPLALWRCFQMVKRWPWSQFDEYLEVPLVEIRREFGVRLVR